MLINPYVFMKVEVFKNTCGDILRELMNFKKVPGQERIYTAGEKEYEVWQQRKNKGVPIVKAVQKEFIELRDELKLNNFKFPFE